MAISPKTRKTLWGKSGDRCASCRNKLIIDATENDGESIVSQECHIRSRKRKGPRHDPTYPKKKLDTGENLILLCNVDHKMVDDQVEAFPVKRLTKMKSDHEAWVSETLDGVDQPGRPRQIPSPPADFVGREDEIREILDSLGGRGATISGVRGMGGIGKTALAYVIAEQLKPDFDAHFYVDLKGSEDKPMDPGDAQLRVLRAYSSDPTAKFPDDPEELTGQYRSVLSNRPALLLMDNAADLAQVEPLVPPSGSIMLVTSRQRFEVEGWFAKDLDTLPEDKSRELIMSIAPRVASADDVGLQLLDTIAGLCGLLPLALRLAGGALAGRPDLTPEGYIAKIEDEGKRLDEFDAVRAVILASAALLDEPTRRLWRLLGIFGGSFDKPAAAAVWQLDEEAADTAIGTLMGFNLLQWSGESKRYHLHDLMRLAARERLDEDAVERDAAGLRFATYYKDVLAEADGQFTGGGDQVVAGLALYDSEAHNVKAAFDWSAKRSADDDGAARLCIALLDNGVYCFDLREDPRKMFVWLEAALAAARRLKDRAAQGRHLGSLGNASKNLGDPRRAIQFYDQNLKITREIGDRNGEGKTLGNLGVAYSDLDDHRRAITLHEQALKFLRDVGDRRGEGNAMANLGQAYAGLGEPRRAIEFYKKRLKIAREIGDATGEATTLGNLGNAYAELGEPSRAIEFYRNRLEVARKIDDRRGAAVTCWNLGLVFAMQGDIARAVEPMQVYVDSLREFDHPDAEKRADALAALRRQLESQ